MPGKNEKLVSIIILNWNGKDYTGSCLQSIYKNTNYGAYEIIVVDNGSTDGSQEMIKSKFPKVRLIENKRNVGFAGGNNIGIRASSGDYVFLLNNDTLVTKNWMGKMVGVMESDEKIGVLGPHLPENEKSETYYGGGSIDDSGAAKHSFSRKAGEFEQVGGAAFMIRREVIDEIGVLDEGFFPIYFEETDYCFRVADAGWKVFFTPDTKIIHFGSKLTSKKPLSWNFFVINKNRVRLMLIHFRGRRLLRSFFWEILRFGKNITRAHILVKAYLWNIKNLGEILKKRKSYGGGK